jgi:hypothetical protein
MGAQQLHNERNCAQHTIHQCMCGFSVLVAFNPMAAAKLLTPRVAMQLTRREPDIAAVCTGLTRTPWALSNPRTRRFA